MTIHNNIIGYSFDTDNIRYKELTQLGTITNRILRCKCELPLEYKDGMPKQILIKSNYVCGKTLAQLEQNAIQEISILWNKFHTHTERRNLTDTMYM